MVDKPAPPLAPLITRRRSARSRRLSSTFSKRPAPMNSKSHTWWEQRQARGPICQGKPSGQAYGEVATRH